MNSSNSDPKQTIGSGATSLSGTPSFRPRLTQWLETRLLPFGLLVLFTGMLWAEDRPEYHTLFYALVAFPAFILLLIKRNTRDALSSSPIFLTFCAFAFYVLLSIAWSDTDKSLGSLLKRPLYILLLFAAVMQVALASLERLQNVLRLATGIACIVGAVSLALFFGEQNDRLVGFRALSNPILTAHVFGFFLAICVASWIVETNRKHPWSIIALMLIGAVILSTASRGGLAAAAVAVIWAAILAANRRGAIACLLLLAAALLVAIFSPEVFTQRGLSLRPQIWAETLREVSQRPWLGYGYDAYIMIEVAGVEEKFPNPHNMLLAVLRQQGIIGLLLWLAIYTAAFLSSWRYRRNPAVLICSVAVMSGLVAGLTEGISYLSRPKEHWFLIWIPLALLSAAVAVRKSEEIS